MINELTQIQEYLENELVNAQNIGLERASISVGEDNSRTILAEVDFVEQTDITNFESLTFGDNFIDYSAVQEDVILGWTDNNIIGSDFNDVLLAQYQGQIIDGGLGDDFLGFVTKDYDYYDSRTAPGAPRDYNTLIGGQGSDTFYVPILKDSLTKLIDFNPVEDTLMLSPSQLVEQMSRWDIYDYIQLNSVEVREGGVWAELTSRE